MKNNWFVSSSINGMKSSFLSSEDKRTWIEQYKSIRMRKTKQIDGEEKKEKEKEKQVVSEKQIERNWLGCFFVLFLIFVKHMQEFNQ